MGFDRIGNKIYELNNGRGEIKNYDFNGRIVFKREYLNGQSNGKNKEYEYYNRIIFEF